MPVPQNFLSRLLLVMACLLMASRSQAEVPRGVPFGKTAAGELVQLFTLENANGVKVTLMTRGATIVNLWTPDRKGKLADIVLGFDDIAGYESDRNAYFGCIAGRVCNRIAKGQFTLNGKQYTLAINNGVNHLHGGIKRSLDRVNWQGRGIESTTGPGVVFTYISPDGEEGYPGNLTCTVTYTLSDKNELGIVFQAATDQATPVNLTNHSYFNLSGEGAPTVLDHELQIFADEYTPMDKTMIPTGEIAPVAGTPLDFRKPHRIGERIQQVNHDPTFGYDHNFVVNGKPGTMRPVAILKHPGSGRVLKIFSTQPCVQLYTGDFLYGQAGKQGKSYAQHSACCLETQHHPDAVNQPQFPTIILQPGQTYQQGCTYLFSTE